jgi:ribosomal protein L11 methyltransferase
MFQLDIQQCHRDDIEQLNLRLENTPALSVTLTDKHDDPILEPELGTTPLWPNVVVQALFAEEDEARDTVLFLSEAFPKLDYVISELVEQDWERVCMADFKPQQFGQRLWICPSWLAPPEKDAVNLILDPGLAFGTGTHPTTSLCLTWLEQADLQNKTIIDFGCGSGILALAALKLGAQHAEAVDIDEQALIATKNNAITNDISEDKLSIGFPNTLKTPVDLVIANILLTPLLTLKATFRALLNENGMLVVSGLLKEQAIDIIECYGNDFNHVTTMIQGDWALVVFSL